MQLLKFIKPHHIIWNYSKWPGGANKFREQPIYISCGEFSYQQLEMEAEVKHDGTRPGMDLSFVSKKIPWKQTLGKTPILRIPLLNLPVVSKKHHIHQQNFEMLPSSDAKKTILMK